MSSVTVTACSGHCHEAFAAPKITIYIRLLTAIEVALHQEYYDTDHKDYQDLVQDNRVIHDVNDENI